MPRHLISDAHEWINEIPTVPIYYLAKPQPRERAWKNQRGKKTLDAHEWINEIPTVPIYYLAKPQPRERAWKNQRGKKTLLSLTLVRLCEMT
ncbi:unnamed protein product [Sphagnum troendelagicum]|uniref:Uncharacterized protein n=2 Tax=Sphagnum TaxID=13804 RepID=A0ABP0UXK7_9BRYO